MLFVLAAHAMVSPPGQVLFDRLFALSVLLLGCVAATNGQLLQWGLLTRAPVKLKPSQLAANRATKRR